jgi:hypothetical protein
VELARIEIVQGRYQEALDRIQGWSPSDDQEAGFALVYGALDRKAEAAAVDCHSVRPDRIAALAVVRAPRPPFVHCPRYSALRRWM